MIHPAEGEERRALTEVVTELSFRDEERKPLCGEPCFSLLASFPVVCWLVLLLFGSQAPSVSRTAMKELRAPFVLLVLQPLNHSDVANKTTLLPAPVSPRVRVALRAGQIMCLKQVC